MTMTQSDGVLLAGKSWVSAATHIKGFDQFSTVTYHLGAEPLVAALKYSPFDLQYMPAHEAQRDFPQTCPRIMGQSRCSSRGLMARVERSRGPPTSGRTGCRLNLRRGPAMRGSGGNRSNG